VRAELGTRTIFNLLGPLCNPAGVRRQMIGVFDRVWQEPIARTLGLLGSDCVWVVHGEDAFGGSALGLDELGLAGPNHVVALENGKLSRFRFDVCELGLAPQPVGAIAGGDAAYNALALERLLSGETGPYRDTVLLNAAAALQVSGRGRISWTGSHDPGQVTDVQAPLDLLRDGLVHAARVIDDGSALAVLAAMRRQAPPGQDGEL
jgi:anthranilate phosphoribosyltransferase